MKKYACSNTEQEVHVREVEADEKLRIFDVVIFADDIKDAVIQFLKRI